MREAIGRAANTHVGEILYVKAAANAQNQIVDGRTPSWLVLVMHPPAKWLLRSPAEAAALGAEQFCEILPKFETSVFLCGDSGCFT